MFRTSESERFWEPRSKRSKTKMTVASPAKAVCCRLSLSAVVEIIQRNSDKFCWTLEAPWIRLPLSSGFPPIGIEIADRNERRNVRLFSCCLCSADQLITRLHQAAPGFSSSISAQYLLSTFPQPGANRSNQSFISYVVLFALAICEYGHTTIPLLLFRRSAEPLSMVMVGTTPQASNGT
jgi:hypothetical protein